MHAWINDKLAIHVDGLISLPFEVAKQANGDVLWSSLWCQILLLYVYWVKKSQQEKGGVWSKHSNRDTILQKHAKKSRSSSPISRLLSTFELLYTSTPFTSE